jgi:hypothetical protein
VQKSAHKSRARVRRSDRLGSVQLPGERRDSPVKLVALLSRRLSDTQVTLARTVAMSPQGSLDHLDGPLLVDFVTRTLRLFQGRQKAIC